MFISDGIRGGSLRNYLKEIFFFINLERKIQFAIGLSSAITNLQENGIVHESLNSNNILVYHNLIIKLEDLD